MAPVGTLGLSLSRISAVLGATGWHRCARLADDVVFERPGYWLRIWQEGDRYLASVMPARYRLPVDASGGWACFEPFAPEDLAPVFEEADRDASLFARTLWAKHSGALATLGVELAKVGVWQRQTQGGWPCDTLKAYCASDLSADISVSPSPLNSSGVDAAPVECCGAH